MNEFNYTLLIFLLYYFVISINSFKSEEDTNSLSQCDFEDADFCGWISFKDYWKITQNVELDAIHSINSSPTGVGSFVYIQKDPSVDDPGYLVSPEITTSPGYQTKIQFYYRKNSISPILDICVTKGDITKLRCLESISDKGLQQWILKNIRLPDQIEPFKIVFRVRNMQSIMDVVAIDQVNIISIPVNKNGFRGIKPQKNSEQTINVRQLASLNTKVETNYEMDERKDTAKISKSPNLPKFNVGDFPSFAQGVDIFTPVEGVRGCLAVRCSFMKNNCLWTLGDGWKRIDGNLAVEKSGTESIHSGYFLVPLASFFEFDLWMSDSAKISIVQINDNQEYVLFTQKGMSSNGWHRFRIPLQAGFSPSTVSIRSTLTRNDFLTISNVKLVNNNGEEVSCETVQTEPTQKIVVQQIINKKQLSNNNMVSVQRDQPMLTRLNGMPVILPTPNSMTPIKPMKYNNFERLTSLQQINIVPDNSKMGKPRIYPSSLKTTTDPPNVLPDLFKLGQQIPTEWKQKIINNIIPEETSKQEINTEEPNIGKLLSQIGGQPILENQLKQLAQRFGFTGINDPRAIELFQKFVNNPIVNQRMVDLIKGEISKGKGSTNLINEKTGTSPIIPVNVNAKDFERVYKEQMLQENIKDTQKNQGMNGDFLKNIAKLVQLPTTNKDDQQALTRNNLDFIVHNAHTNPDNIF
uniref:MAM domain-containing protein n=1 Tax=Parastrongyloides trichosuri TaxID=131310 RepID=A0A0N4ZCY5_PARTI